MYSIFYSGCSFFRVGCKFGSRLFSGVGSGSVTWSKLTEECPGVPGEGERVLDGDECPDHEEGEVPHDAQNAVLASTPPLAINSEL